MSRRRRNIRRGVHGRTTPPAARSAKPETGAALAEMTVADRVLLDDLGDLALELGETVVGEFSFGAGAVIPDVVVVTAYANGVVVPPSVRFRRDDNRTITLCTVAGDGT